MKLSLVATCLFFSIEFISGASLKHLDPEQLIQRLSQTLTLAEFEETVDRLIDNVSIGQIQSIPDLSHRTSMERMLYFSKYYGTVWHNERLVSKEELEQNLSPVLIANNPKVYQWLLPELCKMACHSTDLGASEAVEFAEDLYNLPEFAGMDLQPTARRIIELLETRALYNFNPTLAIQTGDIETLQRYIDMGIWWPSAKNIHRATVGSTLEVLPFLLEKLGKIPDAETISNLIERDCSSALEFVRSLYSDWIPDQDQVNVAAVGGHVKVLEWYASFTPELPQPSMAALRKSKGLMSILEWLLTRYYSAGLASFQPDFELNEDDLSNAILLGCVNVLKWHASTHPGWTINREDIHSAVRHGLVEVLKWHKSVHPAWRLNEENLYSATRHGQVGVLEWHLTIYPSWQLSHNNFKAAVRYGHLHILKWHAMVNPNWSLSQKDVNAAAVRGYLIILEWNDRANQDAPLPNLRALEKVLIRRHWNVIEWYLAKYHQMYNNEFKPDWTLTLDDIEDITKHGYLPVLKWHLSVNPEWTPNQKDVDLATEYGRLSILEWQDSVGTAFSPGQEALDRAWLHRHWKVIEWALKRRAPQILNNTQRLGL